ncbi:hypothetical protein AGR2A_Cc160188 [Agrobacterium genomosp. 2 str. CFBP 5494]|uniref:Uncharacterized protein n=1 Tax=Agrobacterium genomosp. 2 str. CFBP 5494 TaxID=1183436 RepID=A0A9W5B0L5_9HYPH|nr:hypothetical protein AGR2A_Cc160188 [Agrobacterium genomosp. 2 str. CFBP 5494]
MRRELYRADLPHQDRGGSKQGHLGKNGDADRQAKTQHFKKRMPVWPPEAHEQLVFLRFLARLHIRHDEDEAEGVDDDRNHGRAIHAHGRQPEMSENQRVSQYAIHDKHDDGGIKNDACPADGADKAAQHIKQQCRQQAELGDGEIMACQRRNIWVLPKRNQDALGIHEDRQRQKPVRDRHPHAHAQRAARRCRIALPVSLRHHGHNGDREACTKNKNDKKELPGQHHRRQLLGPQLTDDHHIGGMDAKLRELRANKRDSENKRSLEMRKPRPRSGRNGSCNNRRRHCNSPEHWPLPAICATAARG